MKTRKNISGIIINIVTALYVVMIATSSISAQIKGEEYRISPEIAKGVFANNPSVTYPEVFEATIQAIVLQSFDTSYVETEEYKVHITNMENLVADSIAVVETYDVKIKAFEGSKLINTKITEFLNSNAKFKEKRHLLKDAQVLANKIGVEGLIYADKDVNKSRVPVFMKMRFNDELRQHLLQLKSTIKFYPPTTISNNRVFHDLKGLRRNHPTQYDMILKPNEIIQKELEVLKLSDHPVDMTTVAGTYVFDDHYYAIHTTNDEFVKGQLVDGLTISNNKLLRKNYKEDDSKILMKDINTGRLLYNAGSFLYRSEMDTRTSEFINFLTEAGFDTENEYKKPVYIISGGTTLQATPKMYDATKSGNIEYISTTFTSAKRLNVLLNIGLPLTDGIVESFNSYRYGTLDNNKLDKWKLDVKKGLEILSEARKLPNLNMYDLGLYIDQEMLKQYPDFTSAVTGSANLLGL